MLDSFEKLVSEMEESAKGYDIEKIRSAFDVAEKAHQGQKRVSGEDYIIHPVCVAHILFEMGMDTDSIVAAMLHDVVEDTDIELSFVEKNFGDDVALLVDGVTKLGKIKYTSKEQQQAENIRKMLLAMSQDVRVVIIKLADRLHNMRTLAVMRPQKRRDKALETMEVYAPIAHRLGIRAIKEELEDLSLKFLDPIGYHEIEEMLIVKKEQRESFLRQIKEKITERFKNESVDVTIEGRVKSIYGIYRKVYMQGKDFEEIYDIYAVRVIVNTVFECYNILGIVHDMFTPIPNRFKDYISTPKPNMYQSLHTTVLDKSAIPFEIQIRTWDMHHTAEYGIAAHWKYKEGIRGKDRLEERLSWVRQLLEAQKESEDVEDIVRTIKSDIAPEEVFVFTPKGDVISLPTGSTVIDFAYAIHSAIGNRMIGAKVDGKMVSFDFVVKTGMIIDILTTNAQGHGPNRDWLNIVKTSEARSKIRSWFKKEKRDENIEEGKNQLEKEFKRNLISFKNDDEEKEFITDIAKRQHLATADDFFASIGYGGVSLQRIMPRIKDDFTKKYRQIPQPEKKPVSKPKKNKKNQSSVIVEGINNCLVKLSKCCNPLPGDDIVGFITRGYGVSIHKKDCIHVLHSNKDELERWVNVKWDYSSEEKFQSTIEITANSRDRLLADISIAISNMGIPLTSLVAKELKENVAVIQITVELKDVEQLNFMTNKLNLISGVSNVSRMAH